MRKTYLKILVLLLGVISMNAKVSAQSFCSGNSSEIAKGYGVCAENKNQANMSTWDDAKQARTNEVIQKLNLNADQQKAWNNYQASIAINLKAMQDRKNETNSSLSTLDGIEKRKQLLNEHTNLMTQHLEALKTFYLTLTPEQQQIFDKEIGLETGFGRKQGFSQRHRDSSRQRQGRSNYQCNASCS